MNCCFLGNQEEQEGWDRVIKRGVLEEEGGGGHKMDWWEDMEAGMITQRENWVVKETQVTDNEEQNGGTRDVEGDSH